MKKVLQIAKDTFKNFNDHKVLRMSAALAYYAIFSLGPLLFILILLAGFIFGEETVRHQISLQIQGSMGETASKTVESMITEPKAGASLITTIIWALTLVLGASGVFGQLQDALNTVWEVAPKPSTGLWLLLRNRFLSMTMILGLGFLLLISMVLSTLAQALAAAVGGMLPDSKLLTAIFGLIFDFLVVTAFFGLIFKILPDIKIDWKPIWIGAVFTGVLFMVGKFILSLYLARQATASGYGAAGSVAVILLWVYYATLILFLGAEFTRTYAMSKGMRIEPDEYAVPASEETHNKQGIK